MSDHQGQAESEWTKSSLGYYRDPEQTVWKSLSTVEGQVEYHMGCWSR